MVKIINNKINGLINCLFFRQSWERGQIQGKFHSAGIFLTELSTETGDRFALAPALGSLQAGTESMIMAGGILA
jgi:hypothetical protein